ncbi:MAG: hypothetical protein RBR15_04275 [Sphaerochaeta sp.]|nr:hypothetical protein [Sphaerochaeta sp.]
MEKVRDAIRKLYYRVRQPIGSTLAKRVALILPSARNAFFSQILEGVLTASSKMGYQILVYSAHGNHEKEVECLHKALQAHVDALLFCFLSDDFAKALRP